jgi:hypothetical protein
MEIENQNPSQLIFRDVHLIRAALDVAHRCQWQGAAEICPKHKVRLKQNTGASKRG